MKSHEWKKAGCKKCPHWAQGQKSYYPNGFCVRGGGYTQGAVALEKLKRCEIK